jgi:hypothetical protein
MFCHLHVHKVSCICYALDEKAKIKIKKYIFQVINLFFTHVQKCPFCYETLCLSRTCANLSFFSTFVMSVLFWVDMCLSELF